MLLMFFSWTSHLLHVNIRCLNHERQMTVERAISDISSLPLDDQLQIVQALWNQMPAQAGTPLTDDQRTELDRRMAAYNENKKSALTEEQLRQQIRDARS